MRNSKHSISLILVLVLVLVLCVGVFAGCNGAISLPGSGENTEQGGTGNGGDGSGSGTDGGSGSGTTTTLAPTVEPLAYSLQGTDASQLMDCDEYVIFNIVSANAINNENLSTFVEVIDRNGDVVELKVAEYEGVYVVSKKEGTYVAGATYSIALLDTGVYFANQEEDLRKVTFTIAKEYVADSQYKADILVINPQNVSADSAGLIDADNNIYEYQIELIVPYDISSKAAAEEAFVAGKLFVVANSIEEVGTDSSFGKITTRTFCVQTSNRVVVIFRYTSPEMSEIYEALDIYTVEDVDCTDIEITEEMTEAASSAVRESAMFYEFANVIYAISKEANPSGLKDTVAGFLDNFKVQSEIKHLDKGFGVAFSIEYLSDADAYGKAMYAKIAYSGELQYKVKAYAELDGTKFYYDFALIVDTKHVVTVSVQWLDDSADSIVTNDNELAGKISSYLSSRSGLLTEENGVAAATIFGDAKAISKEFSVDLLKPALTYVIPSTPITINLELKWFISLSVQAELFNETTITSNDIVGVRSIVNKETGEQEPEKYHLSTTSFSNDTMLFGTLTVKTGINADAYFSITGMSKWLRIGVDARVGVYLELDGVYAKTEASDDNIKTASGEFGGFFSIALEYKVFIKSGTIVGTELSVPFVNFGRDIMVVGWVNGNSEIVMDEAVTPIIGKSDMLTLNAIDLPAYADSSKKWTIDSSMYSVNDFDFDIADDKQLTYANGCLVALKGSVDTTVTMTLKSDNGVKKTYHVTYTAPAISTSETADGNSYKINFNANGGSAVSSLSVANMSTTTLPTPASREGYSFAGWYLNGVKVDNSFLMTATCDITLVAQWNQTKVGYTYITTAAELKAVANNLSGSYYLVNDINLGGAEWTPIGTAEAPFTGIFDGNNKTICGFKVSKATANAGFFGYVKKANTVAIKNLTISNATVSFTAEKVNVNAGIVAGVNEAIVQNVNVYNSNVAITMKGAVTVTHYTANAGGIVGVNKGTIYGTNVSYANVSTLTANVYIELYSGGFVGRNEGVISGTGKAYGKVATANTNSVLKADNYAGGFVAYNANGASVSGAYVYSNYNFSGKYQGGVVAWNDGSVSGSKAAGTFTFSVDSVGAIVGTNNGSVTGCSANATVKSAENSNVGLIVGENKKNASVTSCTSDGSVIGGDNVGGIIGTSKGSESSNTSTATFKATNKGVLGIGKGTAGQVVGD